MNNKMNLKTTYYILYVFSLNLKRLLIIYKEKQYIHLVSKNYILFKQFCKQNKFYINKIIF